MELATLPKWLDKPALADHLSCSVRWIERRMEEGMPHAHIAGRAKFRVNEVEGWLNKRGLERGNLPPRPTVLYRAYNEAGDLLYVGISVRGPRRLSEHKDQPWWRWATNITLEHFDNAATAADAEMKAIRAERPRFNVIHSEKS